MRKRYVTAGSVLGVAVLALGLGACNAPSLPASVWPTDFSVPAGPTPDVHKMLVPLAQMVSTNMAWSKQPTGPAVLAQYPVKGCAVASTNFAQLSALPDAYEVLVGCPTAADVAKLWSHVNWGDMTAGGWHMATSAYGQYGDRSRPYVKHYVYDAGTESACWAYIDMFTVRNVFGVTGFCDYDTQDLAETRGEAQNWTSAVLKRITQVATLQASARRS